MRSWRSLPCGGLLIGSLASACASGPGASPSAAPSAAAPAVVVEVDGATEHGGGGYVVVPEDVFLYAAPDSAIRFRFRADGSVLPALAAHRFEVVANHGDWVELRAGPEPEWPIRPCVATSWTLHGHGLRVFVARRNLAPVTIRTVELGFEDGTALRLRPGVPLGAVREPDGWRTIETYDARFHAPVPADAIGTTFGDWGPPLREQGDTTLAPDPTLAFAGGEPLELRVDEYGFHEYTLTQVGTDERGRPRIEIDEPCFTAVVVAEPVDLQPDEAWGVGGLGMMGSGPGVWYEVAAGTPVFWADGSEAGRREADFATSQPPIERGALRCFPAELGDYGPVEERTVELCYAAATVEVRPPADVGGP